MGGEHLKHSKQNSKLGQGGYRIRNTTPPTNIGGGTRKKFPPTEARLSNISALVKADKLSLVWLCQPTRDTLKCFIIDRELYVPKK